MAERTQGGPASPALIHPTENGGTLVLVSQDGIQRPPLHFPQGGHLLSFLSCLENGLLPRGQLEPPLWTQQGKVPQGLEHSSKGMFGAGGFPAHLPSLLHMEFL